MEDQYCYFNPQGPRRPRRGVGWKKRIFGAISIPRALAGPDAARAAGPSHRGYFNPQGPRRPRHLDSFCPAWYYIFQSPGPSQAPTIRDELLESIIDISIPRALAGPDGLKDIHDMTMKISIPRALAGPDRPLPITGGEHGISIPRALAGPDVTFLTLRTTTALFQSPGPSQAPTPKGGTGQGTTTISIPRALAGPDPVTVLSSSHFPNFNPQGPRRPRLVRTESCYLANHFNPQGPRRPRQQSSPIFLLTSLFFSAKRQFFLCRPLSSPPLP